MIRAHWRNAVLACAAGAMAAAPAAAQRPLSDEERAVLLQQQVNATQSSMLRIEQRLDAIERQLQQVVNQSEVSSHRVSQLEAAVSALRVEAESAKSVPDTKAGPVPPAIGAAETRKPAAGSPEPAAISVRTEEKAAPANTEGKEPVAVPAGPADPGEDAYSEGFHLWEQGRYDQAITALRAFISGFPRHPRVSFARNLIGRALLDKGEARAAAEALLANYRSDPKGARAADSLYYLGQSLMQLKQPSQACKAYAELEDVYGASIRPDLRSLLSKGKADARCS